MNYIKKISILFFSIFLLIQLTGCVGVHQEWTHASSKEQGHVLVPGHIRWYQFNRGWFNLGGKPPILLGGITYTIMTPSDWFWYGPYDLTQKEKFNDYYRIWCSDCRTSYYRNIGYIKEIDEQLKKCNPETDASQIKTLTEQRLLIQRHNFISDDLNETFEAQFK